MAKKKHHLIGEEIIDDFCTVQMMFFLRHSLASLLIRAGNSTQAAGRRHAHFETLR